MPFLLVHPAAHDSNLLTGATGAQQQVLYPRRCVFGAVLVLDPMLATHLRQVFPQQFAGLRVKQADIAVIPLHRNLLADPPWRRAVVGRIHFHAAIQIDLALAILVVAERFDRQREQGGFFFGEHGRHLPFGSAVNAGVGPAFLPVIQVGLSFVQTFEALSLEGRFLSMADA